MLSNRAIVCALLMICSTAVAAAQKPAAKKPAGKSETLACRLGTEDRHARIAVVVVRGKTDSFAYYSKWKPRTCSIYLQRNRDPYSKWADSGNVTTVNLERGAFLIEHKPGEYHFIFRDIDRERYCGMDGLINGSLTIRRGSSECVLNGDIMVEGAPLAGEQARRDEQPAAPGAAAPELTPISAQQPAAPSIAPQLRLNGAPLSLPATASAHSNSAPPGAAAAEKPAEPLAGKP